jgi:hypothetical protein
MMLVGASVAPNGAVATDATSAIEANKVRLVTIRGLLRHHHIRCLDDCDRLIADSKAKFVNGLVRNRGRDDHSIADVDPDMCRSRAFSNLDDSAFKLITGTQFHFCAPLKVVGKAALDGVLRSHYDPGAIYTIGYIPMRRFRLALIAYSVGLFLTTGAHTGFAADITIFAVASLKEALDEANAAYIRQWGQCGNLICGYFCTCKTNRKRRPANIFISADLDWMDYLEKRNLIQSGRGVPRSQRILRSST